MFQLKIRVGKQVRTKFATKLKTLFLSPLLKISGTRNIVMLLFFIFQLYLVFPVVALQFVGDIFFHLNDSIYFVDYEFSEIFHLRNRGKISELRKFAYRNFAKSLFLIK